VLELLRRHRDGAMSLLAIACTTLVSAAIGCSAAERPSSSD
jgi:hypothetical protein